MNCPKCGSKLFKDPDPDYVFCILHGTILAPNFKSVEAPIPKGRPSKVDAQSR